MGAPFANGVELATGGGGFPAFSSGRRTGSGSQLTNWRLFSCGEEFKIKENHLKPVTFLNLENRAPETAAGRAKRADQKGRGTGMEQT
jgi:hypothetical protein